MMFACGKLKGFFQLSIPLMRNVKYPLEVKLLRSEVSLRDDMRNT